MADAYAQPDTTRTTAEDVEYELRKALRDITTHWDEMLPDIRARRTGTIGRSSVVADLIHEHVLYVRTETIDRLTSWALLIADERDLRPRIAAGDAIALAAFIDNHYDWLARHAAGSDAADELGHWGRAVHGVARPRTKEDLEFLGQCECGQRIHAAYDANVVACASCGREENRNDYRDRGYDVLRSFAYTAEDTVKVGAILGVSVRQHQINVWKSRDRITPIAQTRGGRHLYRWADVEKLATQKGLKARPKALVLAGAH